MAAHLFSYIAMRLTGRYGMQYLKKIKKAILVESILLVSLYSVFMTDILRESVGREQPQAVEVGSVGEREYIKWVDFNVSYEALCEAYKWDVETYEEAQEDEGIVHVDWIELLAYAGARHGGEFPSGTAREIARTAEKLKNGETTMKELAGDMEYYAYYLEAYRAVLGGYVGEYEIQKETEEGKIEWKKCYGLKAFSPIAKGFEYNDYDDFGASRSYGYSRPHLGHDMMGQVGTPIIAIESGYVEAIGWNQYGGWRLGIRSFDGKRYYYYAHLRQNFPYCKDLEEGSVVTAGQVIGYMGHTGYSKTENVNNIKVVHLHWGLQLIFDESQKEGNHEIWIDCYNLTRFLYKNRSETAKNMETKEWYRIYEMRDPAVEEYMEGNRK